MMAENLAVVGPKMKDELKIFKVRQMIIRRSGRLISRCSIGTSV